MRLRIKASARFPLAGLDWQRKLLIGGATGLLLELLFVGLTFLASEEVAFGIAPLAVVLNFPAVGYILQVYEGTLRGQGGSLPEWARWPDLLRRGLFGIGVGLGYGVIPVLLIVLGLGLLVQGGILLFLGMVLMVLGVLAGVFMVFFLPMALAHSIGQGRIEAAFYAGSLWEGINAVLAEYVAVYLLSIGSYIAAALVALVPYLGPLVWPFLCFYLALVQARLFGEICSKAS
ncbi:MAG TPA: DUF4013 domain-containing protein [Candidatus Methylomirabilis sp.]|nr:DUF4013 domain-containing protein [Candidatus Methylomirabilis sp.]